MTVSQRPYALALDMGGTQIRAGLLEGHRLLKRASVQTNSTGGPTGILNQFDALLAEVSEGVDRDRIAGIGLASAGPVDTERGVILGIPTIPGLEGFAIGEAVAERTGQTVIVENDAIAATLGEWHQGAGRGTDNLIYLTVSSGIGGGAVVDGRLLHGHRGMCAHFGHMRLALDDEPHAAFPCLCGARGCFEALASGTALGRRAVQAARDEPAGYLGIASRSGLVSAKDVFDGARCGDAQCISLVEDEARYLGQGIVSLIHLFSPELVVLGGGLSQGFDLLTQTIHDTIHTSAVGPFKDIEVVRSSLGDDSGLVGAAAAVYSAFSMHHPSES
ncbi:MAG: ROK family protein [Pseudomonadota bacterium]